MKYIKHRRHDEFIAQNNCVNDRFWLCRKLRSATVFIGGADAIPTPIPILLADPVKTPAPTPQIAELLSMLIPYRYDVPVFVQEALLPEAGTKDVK